MSPIGDRPRGHGPVGHRPIRDGRVGVIFGGPSPEHDVSILTGLQAARALVTAGRGPDGVEAIYWTKGERFVSVDPTLEAAAFVDGAPKGARELRLVAQPGGGFFAVKAGVLGGGKERRLEFEALVNCCHGGPARTGPSRPRWTWRESRTRARPLPPQPCAWTSSALAPWPWPRACRRCRAPSWSPGRGSRMGGRRRPLHRQAAFWWLLHRYRGHRASGTTSCAMWSWVARTRSRGSSSEPFHPEAFDCKVAVRAYPTLALSLFERPLRAAGASPILSYTDKYLGGEGMVSAARELPAKLACGLEKELREAASSIAASGWCAGRVADRFPGGTRPAPVVGERGEYCAWLVREVSLGRKRPPSTLPRSCPTWSRRPGVSPSVQWSSMGADGSALRSASSIANKLG